MKTIEIVVSPQGDTKITTRGFAGGSCQEASKSIEQALGQRTEERLTTEFYASQGMEQQSHRLGQ